MIANTNFSIIGMVHLGSLIARPGTRNGLREYLDILYTHALSDAAALVNGGVDAIMIENNYDVPHRERISRDSLTLFASAATHIRIAHPKIEIGICALWNDYESSFAIARSVDASFLRIPVFVDTVETTYGTFLPQAEKVVDGRRKLAVEHIRIIADVHVKHAKLLSQTTLEEASRQAVALGADGLIITGNWTGDPPTIEALEAVRRACPGVLSLIGSGATDANIANLGRSVDGVIVGTYLKEGLNCPAQDEVNIKSVDQRIDPEKVRLFVTAAKILKPSTVDSMV